MAIVRNRAPYVLTSSRLVVLSCVFTDVRTSRGGALSSAARHGPRWVEDTPGGVRQYLPGTESDDAPACGGSGSLIRAPTVAIRGCDITDSEEGQTASDLDRLRARR